MVTMRKLVWLSLVGVTACAKGGAGPVVPVAAAPDVPVPPVVAALPGDVDRSAGCCAGDSSRSRPASPVSLSAPRSPADPTPADSIEAAFLDTLRSAVADSTAPTSTSVPRDAVRQEAAELFGRPDATAAAATWDIDVVTYASHARVQYWMDYFTGPARWHFERYLERVGRYDSMIRTRLAAAGLPQDMLYLAMIESGFNQSARSRASAVGLWQFIAPTARRYGLIVDPWVDDRRDPFLATDAAIRFLSELNGRFGSLYLAAAAYNGGPGRVVAGLRRYDVGALDGDAQFFALAEERAFRPETRDYVPKLIAAALLGKEPERYGFTNIVRWQPLIFDSVEVRYAVGLDVLARLAGTTRGGMEELNARFHRGVTPPDRRVWVRVPAGTADSVAARLVTLPARDRVTVLTHLVSRGETLSHISRRYGVSVADIRFANRGMGSYLRVGQRLVIPGAVVSSDAGARTASTRGGSATRAGGTSRATSAAPRPVASARTTTGAAVARRVHIVRQGETPWSISQRFGVSVDGLLQVNGLTRRSTIRPGQALRIPS